MGIRLICGSCRECCKGPRELLITETGYSSYEKDGMTYLATQKNGDCVYLFEGGCSIYEDRPQACQDFDCREYLDNPNLPERIRIEAVKRTS